MLYFCFCLLGLQILIIMIDEFYFHRKRSLPLWERLGHPIDTSTVILCVGMTIFFPLTSSSSQIYLVLAVISCVMVTKDEFVHHAHCCQKEQWLHALLFIIHPVSLWVYYQFWLHDMVDSLRFIFVSLCLFSLYQYFYWNIFNSNKKKLKKEENL